ncbi:hypothetical protein, partial [Wolbachia endosymbiont of Pentidionis agamae]|uniref:hypothetical protein n=1 Tax=Wolbachia endosymbiont of Pentidionis agamae TaxID=3110435 RepID=UPI002FD6D39F
NLLDDIYKVTFIRDKGDYLERIEELDNIKDLFIEAKFVLYNDDISCEVYDLFNMPDNIFDAFRTKKYDILQNNDRLKDIFKEKFPDLNEDEIKNIRGNVDKLVELKDSGFINRLTTEDFKNDPKELLNEDIQS